MKKALLALLSALLVITAIQPVQAQDQKVLVIIDDAINSNNFPSIIHEVCYTTVRNMSCPNGKFFMEGKGAASAPGTKQFHGDAMVKTALSTNPNIKIIFIRVYNVNATGSATTPSNGSTILSALNWVNQNASIYSIDAVSISLSGIRTDVKTKVQSLHIGCTDPSILNPFTSQADQLNAKNIPTFAATGNDGSSTLVGFPACVPGFIGVGTVIDQVQWVGETATNRGPGLDLVANSGGRGSSFSTAVASSTYVLDNTYVSYSEYSKSLTKQNVRYCIRPVGKTSGCSGVYDTVTNVPTVLK